MEVREPMNRNVDLDLPAIAARLEGLEETIISKLIDRAQFRLNECVYIPGKSGFAGKSKFSLLTLRLRAQERMDSLFGRFVIPEERPWSRRLPSPMRKIVLGDTVLAVADFNRLNLMSAIVDQYAPLVSVICKTGDDGHYGSSVEHDVYAIQAIARRIHYGSFYVGESKFRGEPEIYRALAAAGDLDMIIRKLTRKDVEERILKRIRVKTETAQAHANPQVRHLIDSETMVTFYRDTVIPLTKKGEALYLLHRPNP
jgi:chorismate mutase